MLRLHQHLDKTEVEYYGNTVSVVTERCTYMYRSLE